MSKNSKLIEKFVSVPADFTWDELSKALASFGYKEIKTGKTAGSRRRFVDENNSIILLHKPHPGNIVKKYAIRQVIECLKENRKLTDE